MNLPVAILAGGLATRMLPLTENIPKSLLRVAGDFFICHQLRFLRCQNISKVVLCVGHLGEKIQGIVGNGKEFGLEICYSWDGDLLLGTGGALRRALPLLGELFFVLYGDSYLSVEFGSVEKTYRQNNKPALMTVFKNKNQWGKSNIVYEKNHLIEYNKDQQKPSMEYIDYGLSLLRASALQNFPTKEPFDLAELFQNLSLSGNLLGYEVHERFYEVGSKKGLEETIKRLSYDERLSYPRGDSKHGG